MLAKVAIAICVVTEANKETSTSDSARTGCSMPPNHGRLATGEKRLFGREGGGSGSDTPSYFRVFAVVRA
jgi:hypothetical protein